MLSWEKDEYIKSQYPLTPRSFSGNFRIGAYPSRSSLASQHLFRGSESCLTNITTVGANASDRQPQSEGGFCEWRVLLQLVQITAST